MKHQFFACWKKKIKQAIGPHKDHDRKETQTAMVWSCFPFLRSGQNHLAGLAKTILQGTVKGGKKTRQTEEEVGRPHQGMDRPRVRHVPEGSGEQGKNGGNWLRNHLWVLNNPSG